MTADSSKNERYNAREAEARWQKVWAERGIFATKNDDPRPKYYVLEMFPYPSGRIHMGHVRNYTMGDVVARFKRAMGNAVLHPMGWDAFGMPAENAAIDRKVHPKSWTYDNIAAMKKQLQSMGLSLDWAREIATCDPAYYKHQQKMFLDFLKAGLVERKQSKVNWDPVDQTVLANEQVIDGRGWRSGALVEQRELTQWFFKISDYSEDLLKALDTLDRWPEKVRLMQKNWIGRSEGLLLRFMLDPATTPNKENELEIFTTRPDTLFGAKFMAISPDHPLSQAAAKKNPKLAEFIEQCHRMGTSQAEIDTAEKLGFDTGMRAIHPFDANWTLPVYVANFILMDYGTGAIFGCPAHDQRDLDFVNKYGLGNTPVVCPPGQDPKTFVITDVAYDGDGTMINSRFLDGMTIEQAKEEIAKRLEKETRGNRPVAQRQVNYRLRDWGISRQRYWGCPIPIIHCEKCGVVPVPENDLPVTLPEDVTFDKPGNPLDRHPNLEKRRSARSAPGRRDAKPTPWTRLSIHPGTSHALPIHGSRPRLLIARRSMSGCRSISTSAASSMQFCTCFTRVSSHARCVNAVWSGWTSLSPGLFTQGMVVHETYRAKNGEWIEPANVKIEGVGDARRATVAATGEPVEIGSIEKMSKSKKNTVDPDDIIAAYGADTARWFMLSDSPPDRDVIWTEEGVQGAWRFVQRLWRFVGEIAEIPAPAARPQNFGELAIKVRKAAHRALAHVSEDIDKLRFNRCVAHIYEFANALGDAIGNIEKAPDDGLSWSLREAGDILVQLFHPMMPHLAEECWAALGHKTLVASEDWPKVEVPIADRGYHHAPDPDKRQKTGRSDHQSQGDEWRDRGCRSRPRCGKKGAGGPKPEKGHCRPAKDRQCRGLIPGVSPGYLSPWPSPA